METWAWEWPVKSFVLRVTNFHGEALKTQADKRTQPVDVNLLSLSTILDLEQEACEFSGLNSRDGGYPWTHTYQGQFSNCCL